MIVSKITGGLGNQFFQYAAAKSLAIKHNVGIGIDATFIKGDYREGHFRRKFKLHKFKADFQEIPIKKIREYIWVTGNRFINIYIINKFHFFEKNVFRDSNPIKEFNSQSGNVCLLGCFVNPLYFKGLKKTLQKDFELKEKGNIEEILRGTKKCDSVSMHVRRGDLLKLKNAYIIPENYYKNAIDIISGEIKNPKFYVFSDDINWCKENFKYLKNVVFVEGNDVSEDFEIMKNCKHNILSNSTLSWWVGYLNSNRNPIIIAPKHFNIFSHLNSLTRLKDWIII